MRATLVLAVLLVCGACENGAGYSCNECRKACTPTPVQECTYAKCTCYYPAVARRPEPAHRQNATANANPDDNLGYIAPCPASWNPDWVIICRLPDGGIARPGMGTP